MKPVTGTRRSLAIVAVALLSGLMFGPEARARDTCPEDPIPAEYRGPVQLYLQHFCPCGEPADRAAYRRCAREQAGNLVALLGVVRSGCRTKLQRQLRNSTCGRPDAVICCVSKANGSHPHRVARSANFCESTPSESRCVSPWSNVAAGCDASGCTAPICGNNVVEVGEDCDPPIAFVCDGNCHAVPCEDVSPSCGNLTIDAGETCEPPGVGVCARDCQSASCTAPRAGETAIACAESYPGTRLRIDAAASAAGYLLVWNAAHRRPSEILARLLDENGAAVEESAIEVSVGEPCGTLREDPAVGTDGTAWYVTWTVSAEDPPEYDGPVRHKAVHGRRLSFDGGESEIHEFARITHGPDDFQCYYDLNGSNVSRSSRTAISWIHVTQCATSGISLEHRTPLGVELTFDGVQATETSALDGFAGLPPSSVGFPYLAAGSPGLDSNGAGTLWAGHLRDGGVLGRSFIAARWTDGPELSSSFELTSRNAFVTPSPAVASGSTSFLVAWAQGVSDAASVATEIRAVRVSRMDGRLDPDGGLLLATASGGVVGGPDAVFDGGRWLVAWVEATESGNELRAVAMDPDGSVVDATPRLLAGDVAAAAPSLASLGDGRALIAFSRTEGSLSAIRSILVDP